MSVDNKKTLELVLVPIVPDRKKANLKRVKVKGSDTSKVHSFEVLDPESLRFVRNADKGLLFDLWWEATNHPDPGPSYGQCYTMEYEGISLRIELASSVRPYAVILLSRMVNPRCSCAVVLVNGVKVIWDMGLSPHEVGSWLHRRQADRIARAARSLGDTSDIPADVLDELSKSEKKLLGMSTLELLEKAGVTTGEVLDMSLDSATKLCECRIVVGSLALVQLLVKVGAINLADMTPIQWQNAARELKEGKTT